VVKVLELKDRLFVMPGGKAIRAAIPPSTRSGQE
jgi:hypothetical protein